MGVFDGTYFSTLGTDHLNSWAWLIFGETIFFFSSARKPGYFFQQNESQHFFSDKVKAGVFFYINHHRSLIRTCILNFSFINLV